MSESTHKTINPYAWQADPYDVIDRLQGGAYRTGCSVAITLPALADASRPVIDDGNGVRLLPCGTLTIRLHWYFDGTSGPSVDTATNLLASLVHDALYALLKRLGKRAGFKRSQADAVFRDIIKAQQPIHKSRIRRGMQFVRRWYHWGAVRAFGWLFAAVAVALVFSGCVRIHIDGDWQHRAQVNHYGISTNDSPDVIVSGQVQGGSDTDLEPTIKAALTN